MTMTKKNRTDHRNGPRKAQSVASANRDVMQTVDFLIAFVFGWKKVTCIVQKQ